MAVSGTPPIPTPGPVTGRPPTAARRSLRRLRAPLGRPGPRRALDQPHRPDHPWPRGPRGDHDVQPGAGRHPPGPSRRRRPHLGQRRRTETRQTWCGTPATRCASRSPPSIPFAQAGIDQTFQPVTHQRGSRPFSGEALLIDGQLFSPICPKNSVICPLHRGAPRKPRSSPTRRSSTSGPAGDWCVTPVPTPMASPAGAARSALACSGAGRSRRPCGLTPSLRWCDLPEGVARAAARASSRSPRPSWPSGPADPLRHDGLADLHGPAPGGRVGQRGAQGRLRRPGRGFFRVFGG